VKCGQCGAWTEVLATRKADDGYTIRRTRVCGNNHREVTFEVLAPIYRRDPPTVRQSARAAQQRAAQYQRDTEVARLARESSRAFAAQHYGLSDAAVKKAVARVRARTKSQ